MRLRTSLCLLLSAIAIAGSALPANAQSVSGIDPISPPGFGNPANSYSWSMAWFKGKLYVGTARNQLCVEGATADFYSPGYYKVPPEGFPEVDCPKDRYDMDLRAEIWQFDPRPGTWARVYRSPADIRNPRAAGKFVARDIGFRNMIVHREADGTRALYVAGVTTDEYIPELAQRHPPRILRTTDGKAFKRIPASPAVLHTRFGEQRAMGYRAMASYKGRLFVTAGGGLTGDGVILEVKDPGSSRPSFEQVSPSTLAVFELTTFNGALYAGVGDGEKGYAVWRTRAGSPASFEPVVTDGAGRGKAITSVVSMHVYQGRLYVGSSGWATVFPSSELIRINRDDSFDVVVGNPRATTDAGLKFPISGLPDGFGNVFNAHFWRQTSMGGALYLGTNDWSWAFRSWPILDWLFGSEFGFDLYGTCDGQFWWPVTRNAFGAGLYNFGARTLASTPIGGFIGSANHVKGTRVWHAAAASPCRPAERAGDGLARAGRAGATAAPARPQRLLTETRRCGTVLTWDRVAGASRYRVLRAPYVAEDVRVARRPSRPGSVPEVPTLPLRPVRSGGSRVNLSVAGPATGVGTTSRSRFVDRGARRGVAYRYHVVGLGRSGGTSEASNTAIVPSVRPAVTFSAASAAVRRLHGAARSAGLRRLELARRGWERAGARAAAAQLDGAVRGLDAGTGRGDASAAQDARDAMFRLERHLKATEAC